MNMRDVERDGRKYRVYIDGENEIIIGPPEGFVDQFGFPPEMATKLHNCLFVRGILNYKEAARKPMEVLAALQEVLAVDAARIVQAFYDSENGGVP